MSEIKEKKEYVFGELEVSSFDEVLSAYNSSFANYDVYAFIPASPTCDGRNSPTDPC